MITEEEWDGWKDHPVTEALMAWAKGQREKLKEMWSEGGFAGPTLDEVAIRNITAVGAASVYKELADLDYEKLVGDLDDKAET